MACDLIYCFRITLHIVNGILFYGGIVACNLAPHAFYCFAGALPYSKQFDFMSNLKQFVLCAALVIRVWGIFMNNFAAPAFHQKFSE